jgi:2-oxo-3-hexenedioate decarboxylase/2-keto-4-pentenoate hydratase
VRLGADLPREGAPYDRERVARAIGGYLAAIEIVDDRYVDYPSLDTPTLIADDFFGAGCVLGEERRDLDPHALDRVTARMSIDSRFVGSGTGADILGHPLNALVWLANQLVERGRSLRAGEFVLLGSLVQTHWVAKGSEVHVLNDPLGEVTLRFV